MPVELARRTLLRAAVLGVVLVFGTAVVADDGGISSALQPIGAGKDCRTHRLDRIADQGTIRAFGPNREPAPRAELSEWTGPDGTRFLFQADRLAPEAAAPPAAVAAAAAAIDEARRLLSDGLGLSVPASLEVRSIELGPGARGYAGARGSRPVMIVNASGDVRTDVMHQLAHLVLAGLGPARVPAAWAEAFASWVPIRIDGPSERDALALSRRLARLDAGLFTERPGLAAGSAIWFAYLDEAHGSATVRFALDAMAGGLTAPEAFDLALRRSGEMDLAAALRDLQLWSVFVGPRADRMHFSFADRLSAPAFSSTVDGLPALAALSDAPLAPWGAATVSLRPDADRGGVRLLLDGEPGTDASSWQADLLLLSERADGPAPRRLALSINGDGRGEVTVPAEGVDEILLLVRRGGDANDTRSPLRYSYAAHLDRAFPFELTGFDAAVSSDAVQLSWDTASERDLAGYNLLRRTDRGSGEKVINPIRVPGLGDPRSETSYGYLDQTVEPGRVYVYRLQGVTRQGLTALSEPIVVRVPLD